MADLTFNESLGMLDEGEYSHWVKTIFDSIKEFTRLVSIKNINSVTKSLVNSLMGLPSIQVKAWEHFNYAAERVDRRLAKPSDRPDLWGKIIANGGLTRGEQHSTASVFMTAGTETTATLLSGTTYWLLREPAILATLVDEIRTAFTSIPEMTMEKLARLKYLDAVMHEGLRMYPPVPSALPRVVPHGGAEVAGTFLPEGVSVGVHQYVTYHSPQNFTDPDSFRPQRWLGDEKYKDDQLGCVEPFSVGPRNCIGKNLAYHEIRMILAATLLHYDLSLCEESADWTDQRVYILWEKKPLWCTLTPNEALEKA
jgi:cytochrome P450